MTPQKGIAHFKVGEVFTLAQNKEGLKNLCVNVVLSKNRTHMSVLSIFNTHPPYTQTFEFADTDNFIYHRAKLTKNGVEIIDSEKN